MAETSIRVAIIGGGLAGATLARALTKHDSLDVQVYEAGSFKERGAGVGIQSNALRALDQIIPSAMKMLVEQAGAVPTCAARFLMGCGPEAGSCLFDLDSGSQKVSVHRASLLRELLAPLPNNMLHANKRLVGIDTSNLSARIEVEFEDGTKDHFDAVIGADGIFSSVRKYVLQEKAEQYTASPAGFWDCRNLVLLDKAIEALGETYFEVDRQWYVLKVPILHAWNDWVGDGAFLLHCVVENKTMVQCIISGIDEEAAYKDRRRPITKEELEKALSSWSDNPVSGAMISLILDQPNTQGYSQWEHKSTPTYANDRICIMGDAAHAMTPWQGAGAGQAIEDALILATVLGRITSRKEIPAAFQAFDAVRRPRCQQLVDSSKETGRIMCGRSDARDPDTLREALKDRWNFIYNLDVEQHKQEALQKLREFQSLCLNST
ncbi:salicylate hydroxylase [Xylaria castorea]|nr:salicylate hydroxylase [Xylaria castorea]